MKVSTKDLQPRTRSSGRNKRGSTDTDVSENTLPCKSILGFASPAVNKIYHQIGKFEVTQTRDKNLEFRPLLVLQNGSRYEGQWNKYSGKREGFGVQVWANGDMYQGTWKDDKAEGKGRLIH